MTILFPIITYEACRFYETMYSYQRHQIFMPKTIILSACVALFAIPIFASAGTAPDGGTLSFAVSQVDSSHRYSPTMYGGWGAQLGHLLRSQTNGLWYVDDTGNDVNVDPALAYYKYNNGVWTNVASLALPATIQQNTGSVISGDMIYTYGLNIVDEHLYECYFYTTNITYRACNQIPFNTGSSSNYIGATISKSGVRVVWWTNATGATTGTFSYIYNYGGGWNGPVTSALPGYADYSYAYGRLADDNVHIQFVGLSAHAQGGASVGYDTLYASTVLGTQISNWQTLAVNPAGIGMDTWLDPMGGAHFIAYHPVGPEYYYQAKGGSLVDEGPIGEPSFVSNRIIQTSTTVYLVMSSSDGTVKYKSIALSSINGPIQWNTIPSVTILAASSLGGLTIFPESSMYQEIPAQNLDFVANGASSQGNLFYFVGTSTSSPPSTPTLTLQNSNYNVTGTVAFSWNNLGITFSQDWIAFTPANQTWTASTWPGKATAPYMYTNGAATGSANLPVPPTAGTYQLVYYQNNGYTAIARSGNINIASTTSSTGKPSVSLLVNGQSSITLAQGTAFTLSFATSNAQSCSGTTQVGSGQPGAWLMQATNTSNTVTNGTVQSATVTYVLSCTNAAGTTTQTATVSPTAGGQPSVSLLVNGQSAISLPQGTPFTLSFATSNAQSCSGTTQVGSGKPGAWLIPATNTSNTVTNGTVQTATVTYVLSCTNSAGTVTRTATVSPTGSAASAASMANLANVLTALKAAVEALLKELQSM